MFICEYKYKKKKEKQINSSVNQRPMSETSD